MQCLLTTLDYHIKFPPRVHLKLSFHLLCILVHSLTLPHEHLKQRLEKTVSSDLDLLKKVNLYGDVEIFDVNNKGDVVYLSIIVRALLLFSISSEHETARLEENVILTINIARNMLINFFICHNQPFIINPK